jgi:hypothetical protein
MSTELNTYKVTTPIPALPETEGESVLNLFDQNNPDINLFNMVDDELIRLSGSQMFYFKFFRSAEDYDEVYGEQTAKAVGSDPILVHGHYEPRVLEENLTEFGIELTSEQLFVFNKSYIEQVLGRIPIPGDVVLPKFQNQKYELIEVQEDSFESYGVYHMVCSAKLLRDSDVVQDTPLVDDNPDIGVYGG